MAEQFKKSYLDQFKSNQDQHDKKQNQKRYRQQNNRLKVLSKKRELEPSDLSTKNNFREKRLIRLREENRRLVGEVMKTKLELKKKEKLIEQLKIKTKTRTNNAEQGKLINKLKSQLQDATAEKLKLKDLLKDKTLIGEKINQILKDENESLKKKLASKMEMMLDSKCEVAELQKLSVPKKEFIEISWSKEKAVEEFQGAQDSLGKVRNELKEKKKQIHNLQNQVEKMSRLTENLTSEIEKLQYDKIDMEYKDKLITEELVTRWARITELEGEVKELKKQICSLQKEVAETCSLREDEIKEHNAQISILQKVIESIQNEKQIVNDELNSAKERIKEIDKLRLDQENMLRNEVCSLNHKIQEFNKFRQDRADEIIWQQNVIEDLQNEKRTVIDQLNIAKEKMKEMDKLRRDQENMWKNEIIHLKQKVQEFGKLCKFREDSEGEISRQQNVIEVLEANLLIRNKELNEVNKLKEDELKALKNKIKSLNDEIQLICSLRENERHECITETNKLREVIKALENHLRIKNQELKEMKSKEDEWKKLKNKINTLNWKIIEMNRFGGLRMGEKKDRRNLQAWGKRSI